MRIELDPAVFPDASPGATVSITGTGIVSEDGTQIIISNIEGQDIPDAEIEEITEEVPLEEGDPMEENLDRIGNLIAGL